MKLSENLKNIRKENNLSQEQLAEKLGVSRQAVSKWESGQSYPEMDKVLLICKIFNYKIDELMNENVKEVSENKQSKVNINKYIDDFFEFITKTVDMLSSITFRQRVKCLIEQIIVGLFLLVIFAIIGTIGSSILGGLFSGIYSKVYLVIRNILQSIYIILSLIIGIIVLLHIFKIRYLDYYEIVKDNNMENDENSYKNLENSESICNNIENNKLKKEINGNEKKIILEKKKEKIVIRDPEHSSSKFLKGILKIVVLSIKFIVSWFAIGFIFSFISLIALLVLSFVFIKTGILFFGSLLGLISAIIINFIILELLYNFIISKKNKKTRMAISFIISLVLAGISIGLIPIGISKFNYIENPESNIEDVYNLEMTDNLSINCWNDNIEYIETDISEVRIVVKHSKYYKSEITNRGDTIYVNYSTEDSKVMENIRDNIKDINNKEIKNYYNHAIYVYASKGNIEKIKQNEEQQYNKKQEYENMKIELNELQDIKRQLQNKIYELHDTNNEMQSEMNDLEYQIKAKDEVIESLNKRVEEYTNISNE